MSSFVHLHTHTQYSLLDGQASVGKLVDKAIKDGMPGIAITDHGNMFAIKEFMNYVGKVNGAKASREKMLKKLLDKMLSLQAEHSNLATLLAQKKSDEEALKAEIEAAQKADKKFEPSEEQTKQQAELAAIIGDLESMQKEFEFDAVKAREIIVEMENTPAFKPIIGCEVYVARRGNLLLKTDKADLGGYHLILLAKNFKGYKNLIKIVSKAWTDGFYGRPRTDRTELEKYREGLICCSACLGGEIPRLISEERLDEAEEAILWHKNIFGEDYYLELQLHKATVERANHEAYQMQCKVNEKLVEFSRKHNIGLVCTNDVHFVDEKDAEAHDRLICLSTGKDLDDPKRMLYSKQEWMKTTREMSEIFAAYPEAIENTVAICDKVERYSIDHAPIMPVFPIPAEFGTEEEYRARLTEEDLFNEFTRNENGEVVMSEEDAKKKIEKLGGYDKLYRIKFEADYLAKLTMEGAEKRYGSPLSEEVEERLRFELYIMKTMGFPGYFLIVQDFIRAAREELGVWVGPGRGSAAGSAVAYCLGITQIDPIKYDLLFERFLNPDRISLPDIDIDFDDEGRGRVLDWVTKKYGKEKVAHIITYGTMATKMALKDVARVQKLPLSESDRLCKLIPDRITDPKDDKKQLKINLTNAINAVPELQQAENSDDPIMRDTIKYARELEGNVRGTGVHACGTIICRDDITDWVPVSTADDKETGEKMLVTQYEGSVIEDTGLIKMDFLGLKNLSIMKDAVANIRRTKGIEVDVDTIPIDDKKTYELYCEGATLGTFQFESDGMQKHLRNLKPTVFEDLIAMNALYRPGPMDYIPDFIDRKHGRKPIEYDIPVMEKYLKDTYGITVYQEQVMLLSRLLADFTRGEADTLRKAMGKKILSKLMELKPKFLKGGAANGHDKVVLEKIWEDWVKFASYAFNKSHATCYSWVAYQTAYLKANYPSEYMAALLSANLNSIEKLELYMSECSRMGISVLSPDINESQMQFSANQKGDIRFGLAAIKGVGEGAVTAIIAEREKNGPFKDIYDFAERCNYTAVNRKCFENIAMSGGFDSIIDFSRGKFAVVDEKDGATFVDALVRYGTRIQSERNNAQQSLFGGDSGTGDIQRPAIPPRGEAVQLELLNKEKELIGMYLSAHPLDEYKLLIKSLCGATLADLSDLEKFRGKELSVAGIVTDVREFYLKNGTAAGSMTVMDYDGMREFRFFRKDYEMFRTRMFKDYFLLIQGRVQPMPYRQPEELEFKVTSITQLPDVRDAVKEIKLYLPIEKITREFIDELSELAKESKGKAQLKFSVQDMQEGVYVSAYSRKYRVALTPELAQFIEKHNINYTLSVNQ
ncbi:MAG: DNA polymerase III subunit alpha [Alistipes sp.]|nr:DNA polymerase III subunit alpha [Alistipes sp.]